MGKRLHEAGDEARQKERDSDHDGRWCPTWRVLAARNEWCMRRWSLLQARCGATVDGLVA